ncbi:hypothetical protein BYT27DRAFT_6460124 [Phlegmacium glaucopus]|nr:hypothetical protein BYT27DRAFT_6460124 [Phlegmacium glaucopus]
MFDVRISATTKNPCSHIISMFALSILIPQSLPFGQYIGTALPQTPQAAAELSIAAGFYIIRPTIEISIANYFFFRFEDQRDGPFADPPHFTNTIRFLVNAVNYGARPTLEYYVETLLYFRDTMAAYFTHVKDFPSPLVITLKPIPTLTLVGQANDSGVGILGIPTCIFFVVATCYHILSPRSSL